jgi:hypothetical protein
VASGVPAFTTRTWIKTVSALFFPGTTAWMEAVSTDNACTTAVVSDVFSTESTEGRSEVHFQFLMVFPSASLPCAKTVRDDPRTISPEKASPSSSVGSVVTSASCSTVTSAESAIVTPLNDACTRTFAIPFFLLLPFPPGPALPRDARTIVVSEEVHSSATPVIGLSNSSVGSIVNSNSASSALTSTVRGLRFSFANRDGFVDASYVTDATTVPALSSTSASTLECPARVPTDQ